MLALLHRHMVCFEAMDGFCYGFLLYFVAGVSAGKLFCEGR